MKKKSIYYLIVLLSVLSCKKNNVVVDAPISTKEYVTKTQALQANKTQNNYRTINTSEYIDFSTTSLREFTLNGETHQFFYTKIIKDNILIGALIGQVFENRRILNYIVEPIIANSNSFTNYYKTLDNTDLGTATVVGGNVTSTFENADMTTDSDLTGFARSWWGCTRECISDVHIACYLDKECMTLLTFTNVAGTGTSSGGQGSGAIAVACSIACIKNKNMDLLPQY